MHILHVVGARPNFIKAAPVLQALARYDGIRQTLVALRRQFVGHVEAGLRSFDRTMREEINWLVTDEISDLLFTPSSKANENLLHEGVAREKFILSAMS